jgi:integrase
MAHIRKRRDEQGRVAAYDARYLDPTGRERSKSFTRETDARNFLIDLEKRLQVRDWIDPKAGRLTLAEFALPLTRRPRLDESAWEREKILMNRLVVPHFGDVPLARITADDVQRWISALSDRYSADYVTKSFQLLRRTLERAIDAGKLARLPWRKVDLPTKRPKEQRYLTPEEIVMLAHAHPDRFRAAVILDAYTGLRGSELFALRSSRVDWLRRTISVQETITEIRGRIGFKPYGKTAAAARTVSLPEPVVAALSRHVAEFPPSPDRLVFTTATGRPVSLNRFRKRVFAPAVSASVGAPCTPHTLRHSHAAMCIAENMSPKSLQRRLGHRSIVTTLDIYGHLYEDADREAIARLGSVFKSSLGGSPVSDGILTGFGEG